MMFISPGNRKIGKTPNLSLPPVVTCNPDLECRKYCYAVPAYQRSREARKRWDENLVEYQSDPDTFWGKVRDWIKKHQPKYFRFNVSGDCPGIGYMIFMLNTARLFPDTRFLCFTKRYDWAWELYRDIPDNMRLWLSVDIRTDYDWFTKRKIAAWPHVAIIKGDHRWHGYVEQDDDDLSVVCPGECESCRLCWNVEKTRAADVAFPPHGALKIHAKEVKQ